MKEKVIQNKVVKWCRENQMELVKFESKNYKGVADYICKYKNSIFFIEFKSTIGIWSINQIKFKYEWCDKTNHKYLLINNIKKGIEDLKDLKDEIDKEAK